MANLTTLLKYSLKTNVVKVNYNEIISRISKYYYAFGRSKAWPTVTRVDELTNLPVIVSNEDMPPSVSDSYTYELATRDDIHYMRAIEPNDAALVVARYDWLPGLIYDQYDEYSDDKLAVSGAISLATARFYVLTDEFNVYKCLSNNNRSASVVKPTGTSSSSFTSDDGYVWKFMYSIPLALRNKFLQTKFMPIVTSLTDQFYGKGTIRSYLIENKGAGYIRNTWKVTEVRVLNGGSGYSTGTVLQFDAPPNGGIRATAVINEVSASGRIISVSVTNQGRGYRVQPKLNILSNPTNGTGAEFFVEYEKSFTSGFTELKITGDGFNELNPYSIKTVNIIDRGSFATEPSGEFFAFPAVKRIYGQLPDVDVTFREKASSPGTFEVDEIIINSGGFGYDEPLQYGINVIAPVLQNAGVILDFDPNNQKNEAEAIPLLNAAGEITAIQITQPGIGYTFANVEVIGKKLFSGQMQSISDNPSSPFFVQGFKPASIILGFGVGDADSKQSNVELLAVDGSIEVINVDEGGSGYSSTTLLTVVGDGSGCTCQPVVENGSIKRVIVTNIGRGYTKATVVASGGTGAVLRPILSPKGGHGKDAVEELFCNSLALFTRLGRERNQGVEVMNDYRQISIIKDPFEFNSETFYRLNVGSACALIECEINANNTIAFNNINLDDQLLLSQDQTKKFTVIEKSIVAGEYHLVVSLDDNFLMPPGSTLLKRESESLAYSLEVSRVTPPDVDKYSGQMLYIDNRIKFTSNAEQTVAISTIINF